MEKIQKLLVNNDISIKIYIDEDLNEPASFCPTCDFVMSSQTDFEYFDKFSCCSFCAMKFAESRYLIHCGAQELDMVINISALKDGNTSLIQSEIEKVVDAADGNCVKVIIETCLLSNEEIKLASKITVASGADFVKTSTGFSFAGARKKDVQLIRKTIGPKIGVKASGGVKTLADLKKMIQAGANRIGTSNAISIINE